MRSLPSPSRRDSILPQLDEAPRVAQHSYLPTDPLMETHRRETDGRRIFTYQFKQEQIVRVERREFAAAELVRELVVSADVQYGEYGAGRGR